MTVGIMTVVAMVVVKLSTSMGWKCHDQVDRQSRALFKFSTCVLSVSHVKDCFDGKGCRGMSPGI